MTPRFCVKLVRSQDVRHHRNRLLSRNLTETQQKHRDESATSSPPDDFAEASRREAMALDATRCVQCGFPNKHCRILKVARFCHQEIILLRLFGEIVPIQSEHFDRGTFWDDFGTIGRPGQRGAPNFFDQRIGPLKMAKGRIIWYCN